MKNFSDNEKQHFITVCNESQSMAQACAKLNMSHNTFVRYAKKFGCYKPNPSGKGMKKPRDHVGYNVYDILAGKHPEYSSYKLKCKLFRYGIKEDKCEICGWNAKRPGEEYSTCELHHIDGDHHNHTLSNLQILCPNCHSLTANYRSLNRANR